MLVFEKEELVFIVFMARDKEYLIKDVAEMKCKIGELESDLPKVSNEATIKLIKSELSKLKDYVYKMEGAIQIQEKYPSFTPIELRKAMKEQSAKEAHKRREARLKHYEELNKKGKR